MTTSTRTGVPLRPDDDPEAGAHRIGGVVSSRSGSGWRLWRGRTDDPRWVRPTLWGLLAATAVVYLWNLGSIGYGNTFYAAAVQAGTQSWKAWLFGALDAPATITVDKPPAAMWVMALSGRIFGFSSWSMLTPEALMGVASVALVYATVRRWSGPRTALAAAALLAATPVAVLMFRYNNPDALLVLLIVVAAWATTRAVDAGSRTAATAWLVGAGVAVGFGFLTKQLQVMLVVPALGLVYLVVAPAALRRRLVDLTAAGVAIVVSAGWYVLLVQLWPASSRPYIGGSTDNSLLQLAFGYNGVSRILGGSGSGGGPGGGAGGGGGFGGTPGLTRLFAVQFSANISWLLPAALLLLGAGLWWTRRTPRTDRARALLLLGGAWLLVHAVVFSFMSGNIHPYYTLAMAPGLAITTAAGASVVWRHRAEQAARLVLAIAVVGTGVWSAVVVAQQGWPAALGWALAAVAVIGAALLLTAMARRPLRRLGVVAAVVALTGALGASTAVAANAAVTVQQGTTITIGQGGNGGAGRGGPGRGPAGAPNGAPGGPGGAQNGGPGGGQDGGTPSAALVALLRQAGTTWSAATTGAMSAAPLQLASGTPVMAIGGFVGSDPAPTLAQFQQDVAAGQIRYYIAGGGRMGGGPGGGQGVGTQISTWVTSHFTATTVGGTTVYDLSKPLS